VVWFDTHVPIHTHPGPIGFEQVTAFVPVVLAETEPRSSISPPVAGLNVASSFDVSSKIGSIRWIFYVSMPCCLSSIHGGTYIWVGGETGTRVPV